MNMKMTSIEIKMFLFLFIKFGFPFRIAGGVETRIPSIYYTICEIKT